MTSTSIGARTKIDPLKSSRCGLVLTPHPFPRPEFSPGTMDLLRLWQSDAIAIRDTG